MRFLTFFCATFGVLLLASCSSSTIYLSQWQSKPVTIDGDASDWQRPLAYYDKDAKLSYTISNDSTKLYLCIEAFDEPTQEKIIHGGLQLWIDTSGGAKQEISILYPVAATMTPAPREEYQCASDPAMEYDPIGRLRRNFLRSHGEIEVSGFRSPIGGLLPLHNDFGIEVRINWDTINNVLNYEAAIPFSTFYHTSIRPSDSLTTFGLEFTVNGVKRPQRSGGGEGSEGGGGGAGGMGGGGTGAGGRSGGMGRHRGGSGGQSGDNGLSESESFKIRLRLIASPTM